MIVLILVIILVILIVTGTALGIIMYVNAPLYSCQGGFCQKTEKEDCKATGDCYRADKTCGNKCLKVDHFECESKTGLCLPSQNKCADPEGESCYPTLECGKGCTSSSNSDSFGDSESFGPDTVNRPYVGSNGGY